MRTLIELVGQTIKYKKNPNLKLMSMSYGPVTFKEISGNKIIVEDENGKRFEFDQYGRIHPRGSCLLFPETKESWEAYLKRLTDEYYDSMIRIGDVCLVKRNENSDWILAIYDGKFDGKYKAKVGTESEVFPFCISYSENSGYLGRAMFPDWMLDNENEID
jgi:hypothetical protein